jgi:predicted nucleic acid-binding protein
MKCVDTSFCIDLVRGNHRARDAAAGEEAAGETLALPAPVLTEFLIGAFARGGKELAKSLELTSEMTVLEVTEVIAIEAARIGGDCIREGNPKATLDLLIAATARIHHCALVTRDRDFASIPGLSIITY